jgi:hypothetical protein
VKVFIVIKNETNLKTRVYATIYNDDETIVSGNCKVYESELSIEKYKYYLKLRGKIYEIHNHKH